MRKKTRVLKKWIIGFCVCFLVGLLVVLGVTLYSSFSELAQHKVNAELFEAIESRDTVRADAALRNGADIHALAYPKKAGLLGEFVYYNHTPLIRACLMDDVAMVRLLIDHGADVNLPDPWVNHTPLQWTLQNNKSDTNANRFVIARLLIDSGAEIDVGTGVWKPMEAVEWVYDTDSAQTRQQALELKEYIQQISMQK